MAREPGGRSGQESRVNATVERIRDLNERVTRLARESGESSLEAYERLLKRLAETQQAAGERGADWLTNFASAQARFTRELADAYPAAARAVGNVISELSSAFDRQARRVPGVAAAEGEARGAVAREQDLPIANYDALTVQDVNRRLAALSEEDLGKIDAYERRHKNRKSIVRKIESLRS